MRGELAELSTLFEHERVDMHSSQCTATSHCEVLVTLVLSPLATYYVHTTYCNIYVRTRLNERNPVYIANLFGIFTELQI